MQSEVRAHPVQAPIAVVVRRLFASDRAVQAVMAMSGSGKVLAHEDALERDLVGGEERSLIYYASEPGLLFYLRLKDTPAAGFQRKIESMIGSLSFMISR